MPLSEVGLLGGELLVRCARWSVTVRVGLGWGSPEALASGVTQRAEPQLMSGRCGGATFEQCAHLGSQVESPAGGAAHIPWNRPRHRA